MPFRIVEGDITKQSVDAIVNAANPELQMGGGVCGAIFRAAGARELQKECDAIGAVSTGDAVITCGYALPAAHIIHTAGPVWHGGRSGEEEILRSCYLKSLELAEKNEVNSIAFPLISSGIYGYPRREALDVAENAIRDYLNCSDADLDVSLVLLNRYDIPTEEIPFHTDYIQLLSVQTVSANMVRASHETVEILEDNMCPAAVGVSFEEFKPKESFAERLRRFLIERNIEKDSDVYKQANITKDVWSKIFSKKDHIPSKRTAVAIAIALKLNLDQASDLLMAAGHILSNSFVFDQIIIYCIEQEIFDIYKINEILFKYEQPLLGSFPA